MLAEAFNIEVRISGEQLKGNPKYKSILTFLVWYAYSERLVSKPGRINKLIGDIAHLKWYRNVSAAVRFISDCAVAAVVAK